MDLHRKRPVGPAEVRRLADGSSRVLAARHDVVAAYLYGSAARGEPAADLDIALLLREGQLSGRDLEALASQIQDEAAPSGPAIDLRLLRGTSPRFRANVLRDGVVIYEADRASRLAFEARSYGEWLDFKPVWERMRERLSERWQHG